MKRYAEEERKKEVVQEQKIDEYAKKKEGMDQLRKDKEEQKFKEKQDKR